MRVTEQAVIHIKDIETGGGIIYRNGPFILEELTDEAITEMAKDVSNTLIQYREKAQQLQRFLRFLQSNGEEAP